MTDPAGQPPRRTREMSCRKHLPPRDPSADIALEEAPEHFFDQDRWNDLVSSCGGREKALRRISHPDPRSLVFLRREVAKFLTPDGARAREEERISQLGESLVEDFRACLTGDEDIVTGFQPPSIERVTIPAELLSELSFNFEDGAAKGGGYSFSHVRIIKSGARKASDISTRIAAWLSERRARGGDELKKTLFHSAQLEFGGEFTHRAFDAAYRRIYGRTRGRPSSSRPE